MNIESKSHINSAYGHAVMSLINESKENGEGMLIELLIRGVEIVYDNIRHRNSLGRSKFQTYKIFAPVLKEYGEHIVTFFHSSHDSVELLMFSQIAESMPSVLKTEDDMVKYLTTYAHALMNLIDDEEFKNILASAFKFDMDGYVHMMPIVYDPEADTK